MLSIQGPGSDKMAKRTWIHHNYFYNFPPTANNCSAIQIGLSGRSMDSAFSVVEYNLFIKTRGENEGGICNKSCKNIYRYNTFGDGCEELSLRHGNFCEVYGNFFMGSTGLRFSGDDHKIYSNFFSGCPDAIDCTNGDGEVAEGSALTCHDRPDRVLIVYNTIIDCTSSFQEPGRTNGLGATNITFANNIIQGGGAVSIRGSYTDPVWAGNILWNTTAGSMPASGYTLNDPMLATDASGVYHIQPGSPAIGAGEGSFPFVMLDIDGQSRGSAPDAGADQLAHTPVSNRVLTVADVGPKAGIPVATSKETFHSAANEFRVFPNPVIGRTKIYYSIQEASWVKLSLLNASGISSLSLVNCRKEAGNYESVIDVSPLPRGYYWVCLTTEQSAKSAGIYVIK